MCDELERLEKLVVDAIHAWRADRSDHNYIKVSTATKDVFTHVSSCDICNRGAK